ncbi:MAG: 50S ribosomal protein L18 [Nanoarchaeota archaeon]
MTLIQYRRKREGRTNYKKRLILLKSRKARLVIRRTNKNIIAQIIDYAPDGDKVICGANSQELKKLGWTYSTKSIPAAYLTGKLLHHKMKTKKIDVHKEVIVDLGIHTPLKGSRIYAVVKGMKDAGMNIPASDDIYPKDDRITGQHIMDYCKNQKHPHMFTTYNIDTFNETFKTISEKLKS